VRNQPGILFLAVVAISAGCAHRSPARAAKVGGAAQIVSTYPEVVAAHDLVSQYPNLPVLLDSNYAAPDQAPPSRTAERLAAATAEALIEALGRPVASGGLVIRVSRPIVEGAVATVSVTVDFPDAGQPGRRGYETVRYLLERRGTGWAIRDRVQLGIT
jgi:hypothetical protein